MKFNLTYVDSDGSKKTPVVLHRAVFGSIDRFIAFYLEETKGNLPTWLSPIQVNIIPVNNDYHLEYCNEIKNLLLSNDVRLELDSREEKLGYKMRESQTKKIPYTLVIGDNELNNKTVSFRKHGEVDTTTLKLDEFLNLINDEIHKC